MRLRIVSFVLALTAVYPSAALAVDAAKDPDGLMAASPIATGWGSSVFQLFLAWIGI